MKLLLNKDKDEITKALQQISKVIKRLDKVDDNYFDLVESMSTIGVYCGISYEEIVGDTFK